MPRHDWTPADFLKSSLDSATICNPAEDVTRQEFAEEVDVNNIVRRYGSSVAAMAAPESFGYAETSLDLLTALETVRGSREAWERVPAPIRSKFPNWDALATAVDTGAVDLDALLAPPSPEPEPKA